MSRRRITRAEVTAARLQPLTPEVISHVRMLAAGLPDETSWLVVKRALLNELAPADRQLFSTRDPMTKKHSRFNEFEERVRSEWFAATGNYLEIPDDKKALDWYL